MQLLIAQEINSLPDFEGSVHHDGWTNTHKQEVLGVALSYLTPDLHLRSLLLDIEHLAAHIHTPTGPAGTEKSAAVSANGIKACWRRHQLPGSDASVPGVTQRPLPPMCISDNASPAVCTSKLCDRVPGRCAVHIVQIAIRRIFSGYWVEPLRT